MSLLQPFEKPEFKPIIPPKINVEQWIVEQLSVSSQWDSWQGDRLCELSHAFKTLDEQCRSLRNTLQDMKDKQHQRDIAYLKKQSWSTKLKEVGKLAVAVGGLVTMWNLVFEAIKFRLSK